ncbi:MAG TPA: tetratricopeptide repeat protein [Burkholderiaceae bacterium]|nr:tetratricopeptide repeat protein [Burkholderiaceae bacterium]
MSPESVSTGAPLQIGEWRVDPRADEITSGERVVKLEPLRMRLLMALAERPGEVVLSNELLDSVWKGAIVTQSSLYQSVAQLRQLLGDSAEEPRYIATVPRKGYRLVAPVSQLPPEPIRLAAGVAANRKTPPPVVNSTVPSEPIAAPRVSTRKLGRRELIAGGAAVTALLAAGGVWWTTRPAPRALRIAVLPFADGSNGRIDQPLANGITDDVILALGRHPSLEVVTFDAVTRLVPGGNVLAEAAKRLDVAFALTGEMRRAGERVRIGTQLIALPSEKLRQSASFEESMASLSNLPQAIAQKAIDALDLKAAARTAPPPTSSAYEMYVLGIDSMRAKTPESVERARRYFSQGIEIDPRYARNYSGLGSSWIVQSEVGGPIGGREAFARAEPLYTKALQLDPDLVEAKLGLANVAREYQRYDESRRIYEAVIPAHPNNIQARFGLGYTEESDGWPSRAVVQYERAAALDPTHFLIPIRAGLSLMYLGRLAEAEARFRRSIELDSARPNGFYSLGILNWMRGRLDESVSAHREALKRGEKASYIWTDYAFVCTDLGLYEEARRGFERISQLLRAPNAAAVEAGFVWVAEGAGEPAPKALSDTVSSPAPWERLMIMAMAGERPSAATVSAVEREQAGFVTQRPTLYQLAFGRFRALDVASLFSAAGANDLAAPLIDEAERTLNDYEQRGVIAPAFSFHRARVLALRGDIVRALASLQLAVDRGWRRGWWIRRDPALANLREEGAFKALLQKIDTQLAVQRKNTV